jgi:hypothetical protein
MIYDFVISCWECRYLIIKMIETPQEKSRKCSIGGTKRRFYLAWWIGLGWTGRPAAKIEHL